MRKCSALLKMAIPRASSGFGHCGTALRPTAALDARAPSPRCTRAAGHLLSVDGVAWGDLASSCMTRIRARSHRSAGRLRATWLAKTGGWVTRAAREIVAESDPASAGMVPPSPPWTLPVTAPRPTAQPWTWLATGLSTAPPSTCTRIRTGCHRKVRNSTLPRKPPCGTADPPSTCAARGATRQPRELRQARRRVRPSGLR